MNQNDKVMELLINYRSYRYAVKNGIAPFVEDDTLGMPFSLDYGPRMPRGFGGRGSLISSTADYKRYSRAIALLEGAIEEVLDDDERDVIRLKYLERNTLKLGEIAEYKHCHHNTITSKHKSALKKLTKALIFVDVPEIINLDHILQPA